MTAAKLRERPNEASRQVTTAPQREYDALAARLAAQEPVLTRDQLLDLLDFTATKHL
jgi:hypothetical protein